MLTQLFIVTALCAIAFAQDQIDRLNKLPESSECDSVEKNGKVDVPDITGVGNAPARSTCMEAKETAEDRWFKKEICAKYAFKCEDGESDAECKKKNEEACEAMREQWLGKIKVFPRAAIDTSNTRKKTEATNTVELTDEVSWFDQQTPIADYSAAGSGGFCQYRQSSWQDESEFVKMQQDTTTIDFAACGVTAPAGFSAYPQTLNGALIYLLDAVYEEFVPGGSRHAENGVPPVLRKDIRTLNEADRVKYLTSLARTECLGLTKIWGAIHASAPADMHSGPGFLPSHSVFMRTYERALQTFGGLGESIGLHIGGWPADSQLPRWHNGRIRFSAIWGDDYIGPIADQRIGSERLESKSDIFKSGVWQTPSGATRDTELKRSFRNVEQRGGYISPQDVWGAMAVEDPMDFGCLVERSLLHGGHHMVISGHMGNLLAASWDAAFFMHHGFVDCLWRNWQMQGTDKATRASKESYPDPGSRWTRHRATHTAHWTKWTSPVKGDREITHGDAWNYRNSGLGSYKCIIPSLLPCSKDEDCGVPAGIARDDKRLYCAAAGVCAQYVETNAICRNEYGSYLPCRKTTDRCQYSPSLFAKYNNGRQPQNEDQAEAWFCVESPALVCGKNKDKSSCDGAGSPCKWNSPQSDARIKSCPKQVPAFGFGVVETASDSMQSLGATFDFLSKDLPNPQSTNAKSWTLNDVNGSPITATVKPKLYNRSNGKFESASTLSLYRGSNSFGIDQSDAKYQAGCSKADQSSGKFGDYPNQVDRNEALEITFSQPVLLESLNLGRFGNNDQVEIELYLKGDIVVYQAFKTGVIVFGTSSDDGSISDCPQKDGKPACEVDQMFIYHEAAVNPAISSAVGKKNSRGYCARKTYGVGFSLDSLSVSSLVTVEGTSNAKDTTFKGYCSGPPNAEPYKDYDHCANVDVCYMSPPEQGTNNVNVVLVPAGLCGPKGWRPMIDFRESTDRKLVAKYRTTCDCGAGGDELKGAGPNAAAGRYRPLFDLYRVQDRLAGNDDASRKTVLVPDSSASNAVVAVAAALVALLALLF